MSSFVSCKKCAVTAIQGSNPWTWIALLYGLQVVGALLVTKLFDLSFSQTLLPVLILILGAFISFVISRRNHFTPKTAWQFWMPASVYALFIFTLSHTSFSTGPISFDTNLFHPLEYMTLGLFFAWAWYPLLHARGRKPFSIAFFSTGVIFGVSDEIHQALVPGRTPSFVDLGWDFVGLCVGYSLFLVLLRVYENLRSPNDTST